MVQNQITDSDKPPGQQLENLAAIKTPVSFETYLKKEAFLLRKSLFPQEEKNIQVQVITNINTCKNLFNEFSPQDSIFSTWDFRYAWYLGYKYHPCFFVIYLEKKPIGLLPLWYEHDKNQFRWFGSWWMEDNSFWVFNKKYIPLLLSACPPRTYLNAISLETPGLAPLLNLKKEQEQKFILNLKNIKTLDDYLSRLKKKKRYNLKRDYKIINEQKIKIIINRFSDIEAFFALSIKRFKQKGDESDCISPKRREVFRQMIKQAKSYKPRMITTEINNEIASVDIVFLYKNTYTAPRGSNNIEKFPGIGNFMILYQIKEALKMGCKKIDFLQVSYDYKEKLFENKPFYEFTKNLTQNEISLPTSAT